MTYQYINPVTAYQDPASGRPLYNGKLYFGRPESDPVNNPADRINAYMVQNDGSELLLSQPIDLNAAGQAVYSGSVIQIKVEPNVADSAYCAAVTQNGVQKFYQPSIETLLEVRTITDPNSTLPIAGVPANVLVKSLESVTYLTEFSDLVVGDDWTDAIWAAILSLRANPTSLLQWIGGPSITAYTSGKIVFPNGIFKVRAGELEIFQDLGLCFTGQGSRRTNQALLAPTTLLITGTSSAFGIKVFGNGARGFRIEDMDVNYASAGFTGDVIDALQCPGFTTDRVRIGWHTGYMRTARSLLRITYDEFHNHKDIVLDGGVDLVWSDDTRSIPGLVSDFGGSNLTFNNAVFYDTVGTYIKHSGARTRNGLNLINCSYDYINVASPRAIDIKNVDGVNLRGGGFGSSDTAVPTIEWLRMVNCSGVISGVTFNDLTKAGTLSGPGIDIRGCRIFCTDGFTLVEGVITGGANEFGKASAAWRINMTGALSTLDVQIDKCYYGGLVTNSIHVTDNELLSGHFNYSAFTDLSANKVFNPSGRVTWFDESERRISVNATPFNAGIALTGCNLTADGTGAQVINLPTPNSGTRFKITKINSSMLTVNGQFIFGGTITASSTSAAAGQSGSTLTLEAWSDQAWVVVAQTGTWSYV